MIRVSFRIINIISSTSGWPANKLKLTTRMGGVFVCELDSQFSSTSIDRSALNDRQSTRGESEEIGQEPVLSP